MWKPTPPDEPTTIKKHRRERKARRVMNYYNKLSGKKNWFLKSKISSLQTLYLFLIFLRSPFHNNHNLNLILTPIHNNHLSFVIHYLFDPVIWVSSSRHAMAAPSVVSELTQITIALETYFLVNFAHILVLFYCMSSLSLLVYILMVSSPCSVGGIWRCWRFEI